MSISFRKLRPVLVIAIAALFAAGASFASAQTAAPSPAPTPASDLAFQRAASLTHGINLSSVANLTPADFTTMHALGIRFVRFPLDPTLFAQGGLLTNKDAVWSRIDATLDAASNAGLIVDFVVFPSDAYKQQLDTQNGVDHFIMLWQVLARHLASRDPNRLVFELMNESEVQDPYRWIGIESAVVHAIRQIDTAHTIIASGAHYDSIPDLLATQPIDDSNIIYNFHFYEPYEFTHQGATWGSFEWNYFHNIPYPATPAQIAAISSTVPDDLGRYELFLYGASGWNAHAINDRIAFAADWGREHHVPILCNEFGAFRNTAPPDSRARYIHDVRSALEHNGIGWAMWDWSGNFGLATRQGSTLVPDPAIVTALGLHQP